MRFVLNEQTKSNYETVVIIIQKKDYDGSYLYIMWFANDLTNITIEHTIHGLDIDGKLKLRILDFTGYDLQ